MTWFIVIVFWSSFTGAPSATIYEADSFVDAAVACGMVYRPEHGTSTCQIWEIDPTVTEDYRHGWRLRWEMQLNGRSDP